MQKFIQVNILKKVKFSEVIYFGISVILFSLISLSAKSQALPASTKWVKVKTRHFEVFYPKQSGIDTIGYRVGRHLEFLYDSLSVDLNGKPKKFPFIMQPYSNISNGFVSQSLRRSEFFLRPSQDHYFTGGTNWLDLLTIHEYRHVVQQRQSQTGFVKFVKLFTGYTGVNLITRIAAPSWYWEGDATDIETKHTSGGRGESPDFLAYYRANYSKYGKPFKYAKAKLGSFRNIVPSQYPLGYLMIRHMRENYGDQIWDPIMQRTFRRSYLPASLHFSLKKHTGKGLVKQYKEMNKDFANQYLGIESEDPLPQFNSDYKKKLDINSYTQPFEINEEVYYIKSGFDTPSEVVSLSVDKPEEILRTTSPITDQGYITTHENKAYWLSQEPDIRRARVSYSNIESFDPIAKKVTRIQKKTNLVSFSVQSKGNKALLLNRNLNMSYNLYVVDFDQVEQLNFSIDSIILNGDKLKPILKTSQFEQILYPIWDEKTNQIIAVKQNGEQDEIISINPESGAVESLLKLKHVWFGLPQIEGEHLWFVSNMSGVENLFRLHLNSKKLEQMTFTNFGFLNLKLSKDGKRIFGSEKFYNGQHPVVMEMAKLRGKVIEYEEDSLEKEPSHLRKETQLLGYKNIPNSFMPDSTGVKVKRVKSPIVGLRPSNWSFGYGFSRSSNGNLEEGVPTNTIAIGGSLQDKLSYWDIGATYRNSFGIAGSSDELTTSITYDGFLPRIGVQYRNTVDHISNGTLTTDIVTNDIGLTALIPMAIDRGRFSTNASIGGSARLVDLKDVNQIADLSRTQGSGNYSLFSLATSFSHLKRTGLRDLQSSLGYSGVLSYEIAPGNHNASASILKFRNNILLPGLFKNDGFRISSTLSRGFRSKNNTEFGNALLSNNSGSAFSGNNLTPFARYSAVVNGSYIFPIAYPDISIGSLFNLKRIGGQILGEVFLYDITTINEFGEKSTSFGDVQYLGRLFFDVNFLNFENDFRINFTVSGAQFGDLQFSSGISLSVF